MDDLTDYDFNMALRNPANDRGAFAYGLNTIHDWFDFEAASAPNEQAETSPDTMGGGGHVNQESNATAASGVVQEEDAMDFLYQDIGLPEATGLLSADPSDPSATAQADLQPLDDVTSPQNQAGSDRARQAGNNHGDTEMADAAAGVSGMAWSVAPLKEVDEFATLMSDVELLVSEGHFNIEDLNDSTLEPPAPPTLHTSPPAAPKDALNEVTDASRLFGLDPQAESAITAPDEQTTPVLLRDQAVSATLDRQQVAPSPEGLDRGAQSGSAIQVTKFDPDQIKTKGTTTPAKFQPNMSGGPPNTPAPLAEAFVPYERGHHSSSTPGAASLRKIMNTEQNVDDPPELPPIPFDPHASLSALSTPLSKNRKTTAAKKPRTSQPSEHDGLSANAVQSTIASSPAAELSHKKHSAALPSAADEDGSLGVPSSPETKESVGATSAEIQLTAEHSDKHRVVRLLQQKPRRRSSIPFAKVVEPAVDDDNSAPLPKIEQTAAAGDSEPVMEQEASSELSSANEDLFADPSMLDVSLAASEVAEPEAKKKAKKPAQKREVQRKSTRPRQGTPIIAAVPATAVTRDDSRPAKRQKTGRHPSAQPEQNTFAPEPEAKKPVIERRSTLKTELKALGTVDKADVVSKRKTRGQEAKEAEAQAAQPNAALVAKKRNGQRKK